MTLGEQIRAAREAKNLSQEELAGYLGVSRQAVSKWENDTAVPQGSNRAALMELLQLSGPQEPAPAAPGKSPVLFWLGWALAAALLLTLLVLLLVSKGRQAAPDEPAPAGTETAQPEITSVLFYSHTKELVQPADWPGTPSYNAARIDSILLQWTGDAPLQRVRMLLIPTGSSSEDPVTPLVWDLEAPAETGHALLLAADPLHQAEQRGYLQFELHFADRVLRTDETACTVYFDAEYTVLAYCKDFDGVYLTFDEMEWVPDTDEERLRALGVNPNELNNGFYLYNEQKDACRTLRAAEDCTCRVLDWQDNFAPIDLGPAAFAGLLAQRKGGGLYHLTIRNGEIAAIDEQYVP